MSNLPFLSKILKHAVTTQRISIPAVMFLFEPFQFGFYTGHRTGTTLLRVTNEHLLTVDLGHLSILLLLDLTAACDNISHTFCLSH